MKRLFEFGLILLAAGSAMAQPQMQAGIGQGSTPNKVKIYIRPDAPVNGQIATLNLNVCVPSNVSPAPVLSIFNNPYPGATFQINFTYSESGYRHYNIANLTPFMVNITANTETEILELNLTNGTTNTTTVSLVTLPDGGVTTPFALFYCTGAAVSNGSALYYTRAGTTVNNQFSYTSDPNFGSPPGTSISTAVLNSLVSLPVKWLRFDVTRWNDDARLDWKVANEESNKYYEVQRSTDGNRFTTLNRVDKTGTGSGEQEYRYTDPGITTLGVAVIYYRLKQVDIDGKFSYSEIRMLNLGLNNSRITVYPNPVHQGFYVVIPAASSGRQSQYLLELCNASGQKIQKRNISPQQAGNYYFDISRLSLASGIYLLRISRDGEWLENRQLFIQK